MSERIPGVVFSGTIEPTKLSVAYRFGLVVVAAAMLLLPVLYLGLIALTGSAVWWHVTANTWMVTGRGSGQVRLLLYLAPAVIGLVLVFFMVKPILARPSRELDPVRLDPDEEPVLLAFIEAICRQVRAPIPRRVDVDCRVNASAGFARRRFAVFTNDLVLTIGLPLAAGLSVRELGGVLAHEFGHFAQGGGMRLTALVRAVNAWFARVVYERDEWDDKLARWSRDADWRLSIILVMARAAVWLSRQILRGLMMGGHAISCFMLRQMEFDADSYEIKVAGSSAFARTSLRMREMNAGSQYGYGDLREGLRSRMLPAHLPAFVVARCERLPEQVRDRVRQSQSEPTGWFDTHPADEDRIRAAEKAAAPGVMVGGDVPATTLFHDFDAISAAATRHHYEHELGIGLHDITFIGTGDAIQDSTSRDEQRRALHAFFGDSVSASRLLAIPDVHALDEEQILEVWRRARAAMDADTVRIAEHYRQFEALQGRLDKALAAQELLGAGFSEVAAAQFDLPSGDTEGATKAEHACREQRRALTPALGSFETAAGRRLACAVRLSNDGADPITADLIRACNAIAGASRDVHDLYRRDVAFRLLHFYADCSARPEAARRRMDQIASTIHSGLEQLRDTLSVITSPSGALGSVTLAERCGLGTDVNADDMSEILDRVFSTHFEVLSRLCAIALAAEARLDETELAAQPQRPPMNGAIWSGAAEASLVPQSGNGIHVEPVARGRIGSSQGSHHQQRGDGGERDGISRTHPVQEG